MMLGLCLLFYCFPLFRVVPLQVTRQQSESRVFDADVFVEKFWEEELLPAGARAVDANELLAAFQEDPQEARTQLGNRLGLSSTVGFLVSGKGSILTADNRAVSIDLTEDGEIDVLIETGPVFGNTIRDGSGLLDVNTFPNSRDFNEISAEINRRVEERVFPILRQKATAGVSILFAGCVDITDPEEDLRPLRLVPIMIEIP
jgi:predicted lipoprotein